MTTKWRPDGYLNPYKMAEKPCNNPAHGKKGRVFTTTTGIGEVPVEYIDTCQLLNSSNKYSSDIYEAGADALLTSLIESGIVKESDLKESAHGIKQGESQ